jgi:hypothetical protein
VRDVTEIILANPAIEVVGDVQSQWVGPASFSFKAEVDFDGTYLAASLQPRYDPCLQDGGMCVSLLYGFRAMRGCPFCSVVRRYEPLFTKSRSLKDDLPVLLAL